MPKQKRFKTKYPGVYYIEGTSIATKKPEKIYYIYYRRNRIQTEEKVGRQFQDNMTPARASAIRALRINKEQLSNREQREAKEAKKQAQIDKWTFTRLWEEYKIQNSLNKSLSIDNYRFLKHIKPILGNKEPKELVSLDVDRIRINLQKKLKPQSVKHVLTLINRIVNFGVNKNLCDGLSFSIKMPTANNQKTEDLTRDQLAKLLEVLEQDANTQAANIMRLALYTGMRKGELFRLKWSNIDFERDFILIRDPKGELDQKIPLNAAAREMLTNHPKTGSPFVFPGRGGKQRTDIRKPLNRIKKKSGWPKDFRPLHGLRHVYASMLASSGRVDMYTLQKLLTHKSPQMTQRYAHLRDEALKRAATVADELLSEAINGNKPKLINSK